MTIQTYNNTGTVIVAAAQVIQQHKVNNSSNSMTITKRM